MYELACKIGHRGLAAHAPENTLAGIRAAHSIGLRWVEVDIRLSLDGVAMLSHDASLERCGGRCVKVGEKIAAELVAIPVPCGFVHHASECLPTLADALALLDEFNMGAVLEIKPDYANEVALIRAVCEVVRPGAAVIVSSFSLSVLHEVRTAMPSVARAVNCVYPTDLTSLHETSATNLHCSVSTSPYVIRTATTAGFGVYCFITESPTQARNLLATGAHGVFTGTGLPTIPEMSDYPQVTYQVVD